MTRELDLGGARPRAAASTALGCGLAALTAALFAFGIDSDGLILGNDVIPYAAALAEGDAQAFWNPHHLLFHPLAWLVHRACGALGVSDTPLAGALAAQRLVSAFGGALAAAAVAHAGARRHGWFPGVLYGSIFAAAAGNWLYAAVGETYLPATAALAWLLVLSIEERLGAPARPRLLAALLILAGLLRQDSVLVVPALALVLPPRAWARVTASAGIALVALYAAAWLAAQTELSFVAWLRGLAESGPWGNVPGTRELGLALGVNLLSYAYVSLYALPLGVASAALLVLPLVPPRRLEPGVGRAALACLVFALTRFAFFAWWQPGNMEYHAGTLLPLALLHVLLLPRHRESWLAWRQVAVLDLALYAVAAGNWLKLIAPFRANDIDARTRRAIELAAPSDAGSAASGGPPGLVVALDQLQHYAVLRAKDALLSPVETFDAGAAALAPDSPAARAARARVDEVLGAGGTVVLIRDIVLIARLEQPPWPVDEAFLAGVLGGREFLEIREQDPAGATVLGMVVLVPPGPPPRAE